MNAANIFAVFLGAGIGGVLRWLTSYLMGMQGVQPHWATLSINLIGAVCIGFVAARIPTGTTQWLFVATGLLGGFTTFSALSLEFFNLLNAKQYAEAWIYMALSVLFAATGAGVGHWFGLRTGAGS